MAYARIDLKPGVVKDETDLSSRPRWTDSDKVRFYRDRPQPIGGWELASVDTFDGLCRGLLTWSANDGRAFAAVGTSTRLYALYGGRLFNITPIRSSATLGTTPIATTFGSSTVTITHASHGAVTGDTVYIHTPVGAVNGVTVGGDDYSLSSPFDTVAGSAIVTVNHTGHGLSSGDIINFAGASAGGGITLNGDYTVYRLAADVYQVEHSAAATSTATGVGGTVTAKYYRAYELTVVDAGSYTVTGSGTASSTGIGGSTTVEVKYELNVGNEHGLGGGGYGLGTFGSGGYGAGVAASSNYPRTWSLAAWGQYLNACPRGGTIYEWQLNTSARAAAITNAPSQVNTILVTPERHLVALGAHDGTTYQPLLVRWSDQENNTVWAPSQTNQAGDFPLGNGSTIVTGRASSGQCLIWTDKGLHAMRYDPTLIFTFTYLGDGGAIGPNAVNEQDGRAFWVGPGKQFYLYDGSTPRVLDCPVRSYVFDNLSPAQQEKIWIGANTEYTELWMFYPAGTTNLECSNYVAWNYVAGHWVVGTFDRTAWVDRSSLGNPLAASSNGRLYFHEAGTSNEGAGFEAYIESSPFELGDGQPLMDVWQFIPDFQGLAVGVYLTLEARPYPQGTAETFGPYLITPGMETYDLRVDARQLSVKFTSALDANAFWRLGDLRFDVEPAGRRR